MNKLLVAAFLMLLFGNTLGRGVRGVFSSRNPLRPFRRSFVPKKNNYVVNERRMSYHVKTVSSTSNVDFNFSGYYHAKGSAIQIWGSLTGTDKDDQTSLDFSEQHIALNTRAGEDQYWVNGVYNNIVNRNGRAWEGSIMYEGIRTGTIGEYNVVGGTGSFEGVKGMILTKVPSSDTGVFTVLDLWF